MRASWWDIRKRGNGDRSQVTEAFEERRECQKFVGEEDVQLFVELAVGVARRNLGSDSERRARSVDQNRQIGGQGKKRALRIATQMGERPIVGDGIRGDNEAETEDVRRAIENKKQNLSRRQAKKGENAGVCSVFLR